MWCRYAVVVAVLTLAACAKPLEVSSITSIKTPPGTQGLDIYAARRQSGEKVPDLAGDQLIEVRSFAELESGAAGDEFAGANCIVKARDFSAEAVTPAKLRVPIYRAQSSPLTVQCDKAGYKPRMTEVAVYNATKAERYRAVSGGGLASVAGAVIVTAINAASDESTHDFRYPVARVVMTPLVSPKADRR